MKTSLNILSLSLALLPLLTSLPSQAQLADAPPAPSTTPKGNSEHLSSNTIRAKFRGLREMDDPYTMVPSLRAIFEVTESLAYQIDSPHGSERLQPGDRFSVSLERGTHGQPDSIIKDINQMKEGDSAVMLMSTLFLRNEGESDGGRIIRPCTRFAADKPVAPARQRDRYADYADQSDPSQLDPHAPIIVDPRGRRGQYRNSSRSVSISVNNGEVERVEHIREYDPQADRVVERLIINGVEVDPHTRQPLSGSGQSTQRIPAPRPQPTAPSQPSRPQQNQGPTESEQKGLSF